jgi:hypothetical protein
MIHTTGRIRHTIVVCNSTVSSLLELSRKKKKD